MQHNYVTTGEFREFVDNVDDQFQKIDERFQRVDERFQRVDERFDALTNELREHKEFTRDGFEKAFEMIETVEKNLGKKIDDFRVEVVSKLDNHSEQLVMLTKTVNLIAATLNI